jgi:hypothetical protein
MLYLAIDGFGHTVYDAMLHWLDVPRARGIVNESNVTSNPRPVLLAVAKALDTASPDPLASGTDSLLMPPNGVGVAFCRR